MRQHSRIKCSGITLGGSFCHILNGDNLSCHEESGIGFSGSYLATSVVITFNGKPRICNIGAT